MHYVSITKPSVSVAVVRTKDCDTRVPLPQYQTDGSAGMDVRANLTTGFREKGIMIEPLARKLVPTGLILEIPVGFEMQVRPRSGLALKSGITLANSPGTLDSDYRGEVGVIMLNLGEDAFRVMHGDRIAQLVLAPVSRCAWDEKENVGASRRGDAGFGSTGV